MRSNDYERMPDRCLATGRLSIKHEACDVVPMFLVECSAERRFILGTPPRASQGHHWQPIDYRLVEPRPRKNSSQRWQKVPPVGDRHQSARACPRKRPLIRVTGTAELRDDSSCLVRMV